MGADSMLAGPTADGNVAVAAAGGDVTAAVMDGAAAGAVLDNAAPAIAASAIWGRAQKLLSRSKHGKFLKAIR
jgi:hypothetical protein